MLLGDPKKIDLGSSSFKKMRVENNLYIDKTRFIEHFLLEPNSVQLVVRQRRLGKSLNMDTLRCFLTDSEDNRHLFAGAYIEKSPVWNQANSAPVFFFDFKNLDRVNYKAQIQNKIVEYVYNYVGVRNLKDYTKYAFDRYMAGDGGDTNGFLLLSEIVFETTGKYSYILIDEYDKLLMDNHNNDAYDEIKEYETGLLSAGLKGNRYLKKALLTGVMRVSRESILSGLNNLSTYSLFADKVYTSDFGLSEAEIQELRECCDFDAAKLKDWYDGIKINGRSLYNIYSVFSYMREGAYKNYWGRSGAIDMISGLLDESRRETIMRLLNGETINTYVSDRISLNELAAEPDDNVVYSLLTQAGYLSLEHIDESNYGAVKIPNKELAYVWKDYILSSVVKKGASLKTMFDNIDNLDHFSNDVEYFLNDRLSYFDMESKPGNGTVSEKTYHVFMLGLLSAYEDISFIKPPFSNRESGDGRYDIMLVRKDLAIVFEFKSTDDVDNLASLAAEGLKQIDEKRYYADAPRGVPLIKTAIAFCGKRCRAMSSRHERL